jgi:uncharacterized membrane protein YfcA
VLVLALSLAVLIGLSLGLLGGGGSILTVPILSYVVGMEPKAAIASSLFVVGASSAAGLVAHARAGRVRWPIGLVLGAGGMAGAYLGGWIAGYLPGRVLMLMFVAMMVVTAIAMLRGRRGETEPGEPAEPRLRLVRAIGFGIGIGLVAGTVGAGGGFLVVPALVLLGGLRVHHAVGTSLLVIALQSFAGLAGHLGHVAIDWPITLAVTGVAIVGSLAGGKLAGRVPPESLRRGFGILVAVIAAFTLAGQLLA